MYIVRGSSVSTGYEGCSPFGPCPHKTQSGFVPLFLHSVRSQSEGILPLFFASAIEDCLIPKNSANSTCVLHPAASKKRSSGVGMGLLLLNFCHALLAIKFQMDVQYIT